MLRKTPNAGSRAKRALTRLLSAFGGLPPVEHNDMSQEKIVRLVARDDPVIFEIGCNDGGHTRWFVDGFKNPRIHCFEPDPRAIRRFEARVGQPACAQLHRLALGAFDGHTTFHQSGGKGPIDNPPEGWDASGSIKRPKNHLKIYPEISFENSRQVELMKLDTFCARHGIQRVDLIWMDVQGAELDVIMGGERTLQKTALLYAEYDDHELYEGQASLRTLLRQLRGFKVLQRFEQDVLLANAAIWKRR